METLILHPKNEVQLTALKAIAKALEISFEITKNPYNPEFVNKIKLSKQEIVDGKVTRVEKEDLQALLGL
ncbi:DUF2683 family protein [Pedobacter sp. N23S346]|uniref:DUF2683 family protein n=1 Tax=Pedobacter sp. N23S346 TaxID=3402750 RepID=UPI003ACE980F